MTALHLASGAFTRNQKQPPMHLSRRRLAGALVCVLCTYPTASFPLQKKEIVHALLRKTVGQVLCGVFL